MLEGVKLIIGVTIKELQENINTFTLFGGHSYTIKSCEVQLIKTNGEVFFLATIVYSE